MSVYSVSIAIYDKSSGRIKRRVMCPRNSVDIQITADEKYLETIANDLTQYVKDGEIVDRPKMSLTINKTSITANGTDKVTITGIPKDTTVRCGSNATTVTDGTLEFTTEVSGKYVLKFENFPYQEMEVEIDAT